jgi:hypothetical protein
LLATAQHTQETCLLGALLLLLLLVLAPPAMVNSCT